MKSTKAYESIEDAQSKAFDVIESGELVNYLKKHNIPIKEPKKNARNKNSLMNLAVCEINSE